MAHPAPTLKMGIHTMDTGAVVEELRRRDLKRELVEDMRSGRPITEMLADADARGFTEAVQIIEKYGPKRLRQ